MSSTQKSKTIIVTGGGRGIGKAITRALLRDGYEVVICGRNEKDLTVAVSQLKRFGKVRYVILDLANRKEVADFTKRWKTPLYGIVNNAGIAEEEGLLDSDGGSFGRVMGINLNGPYYLTKGLAHHIVRGGRIVNISSQLGKEGRARWDAYCASKFGLIGLTKCWAKELGPKGITANAVCPGWVKTDMGMKDLKSLARVKKITLSKLYQQICEPLELKRFTEPEEVANVVSFLVSPRASGVTGRAWSLNAIWTNG